MSVWSGAKEFQILWFGRGHTAGDLLIYVPSERAAASGDLVFKGMVGWQGDAFMNEQRPEVHDPEHAKEAWKRAVQFLHGQLGAGA